MFLIAIPPEIEGRTIAIPFNTSRGSLSKENPIHGIAGLRNAVRIHIIPAWRTFASHWITMHTHQDFNML